MSRPGRMLTLGALAAGLGAALAWGWLVRPAPREHPPAPRDEATDVAVAPEGDAAPAAQDAARDGGMGRLEGPTHVLRGRVEDLLGAPVAGARVLAGGARLWPPREAATDEAGHFVFEDVPAGDVDLWVRGEGVAAPVLEGHRVGEEGGELSIRVSPAVPVAGVVRRRGTAEPVAGARIALSAGWPSVLALRATSLEDGSFALGCVAAGEYSLSLRARGLVPRPGRPLRVGVPGAGAPAPLDVRLSPGGTLVAAVVGPDGQAVEGARVWVEVAPAAGPKVLVDGQQEAVFERVWPLLTGGGRPGPPRRRGFSTGSDGLAVVSGLPAGEAVARARAKGWPVASSRPVRVREGGRAAVRLRLVPGVPLGGRVLDEDGRPVPGARIWVEAAGVGAARADEQGRFGLSVPVRDVQVVAEADGYLRAVHLVAASEDESRVELVLRRPHGALRGWVVDAAGDGIGGATVQVLGTSGQALVVRTARDGAFSAQPTSPGPWRVRATHPGYAASGEAVVSGSEPPPTLVLRPGGTLEVEVLDAAYDPVEGAVVAVDGPEARKSHVDESSGVIRFERLPAGAYDVSASAPGKLQEELEEVKVEEEREASIRLVLEDAGALGGKVLGLNGLPLAGVVVTARPSGVRSRTDGAGRFDLDGLPPGPVTLVATLPGWKTLRVEENVVAGERFGDLVLHLEKAD